jgi:hypothetical protein
MSGIGPGRVPTPLQVELENRARPQGSMTARFSFSAKADVQIRADVPRWSVGSGCLYYIPSNFTASGLKDLESETAVGASLTAAAEEL